MIICHPGLAEGLSKGTAVATPDTDLTVRDSEIYDVFDPYLDSDSAILGLYHLPSFMTTF
jgi:hypothetical protein